MSFIKLSLSIIHCVYTYRHTHICVWFPHIQNPENDVKIIHISESLLSPAKPREFGMMSHSQVTFIGQINN